MPEFRVVPGLHVRERHRLFRVPTSRVADPGGFYPDPIFQKKIGSETGSNSDPRKKPDPDPA